MTADKAEQDVPEFLVYVGWFIAISLIAALTTNRLIRGGGAFLLGVLLYFVPPKPKTKPILYFIALGVATILWIELDRIQTLVRQLL